MFEKQNILFEAARPIKTIKQTDEQAHRWTDRQNKLYISILVVTIIATPTVTEVALDLSHML